MQSSSLSVWIWQRMVSAHMGGLAVALAERGVGVTFVAESFATMDRKSLGWIDPNLPGVDLVFVRDLRDVAARVAAASADSIHLCQGLRANGLVGHAQTALARRGLEQWVLMESVDNAGWRGAARRWLYRRVIEARQSEIAGILAIGAATPAWLVARGARPDRVFPFTYFLPEIPRECPVPRAKSRDFRVLFVGQFVPRKRLDLLIEALARLGQSRVSLTVVGAGPLGEKLRVLAEDRLGGRLHWLGRCLQPDIPDVMAAADCLVLPSRFDGWGAVASEALMAGTAVICSDRCGCAEVVRLSAAGDVFRDGDLDSLVACLARMVEVGPIPDRERQKLAAWARCLGASAGADYLLSLLLRADPKPDAPWVANRAARTCP